MSPEQRLSRWCLLLLALAACHVSESGSVPCADDSSCPSDYPVCSGASNGTPGRCVSGTAASDGGSSSAAASVAIVGVVGHQPSDIVAGTVRVAVSGQAASGVLKVVLQAGTSTLTPDADSAPPLWYFDYATTGAGDVQLIATLTPGDPSVQPAVSAPYTLHVDNGLPTLTLSAPTPADARPGELVTATLTSTKPLASVGGTVVLQGASTPLGSLFVVSGSPGTDSTFTVGISLPQDTPSGTYTVTATGKDAAGNAASAAPASFTVYGAFTLGAVSLSSSATEQGLPAGSLDAAFTVEVAFPATVPTGPGAAVFTLTDAAGHQRVLGGNQTSSSGAQSTTVQLGFTIEAGDANGPATVGVVVTDNAGNSASGSARLIIDLLPPYLIGLAPDLALADPSSGTPAGTVHFTGTASESLLSATWSITSGGTGSGACTCNGGSCAGGQAAPPLVSCAVPVPTVSSLTPIQITVALEDDVSNASVNADNEASFQAVPLPSATSLTPALVTITTGTSTNLVPTFSGGTGVVTNNIDSSIYNVVSGTSFQVSPAQTTRYSLIVTNAVGRVFSPAPTSTVTVNPPLTFAVTYVPTSGAPTPGAIPSGASTGTLTFSIPALTGFISATILDAGGNPVVLTNGGLAVSSMQIFNAQLNTISGVQIPTTRPGDVRTLDYTLQLTNAGNGLSNFIATLQVIPTVALTGQVAIAPEAISGGSTSALTLSLPQFSSSVQTVSFATASGATLVTSAGAPLTSELLIANSGGAIAVAPPTSNTTAPHQLDTFILTAANAASTLSQTATLDIYPLPQLAPGSLTVTPGAITGATTPLISIALPALASDPTSVNTVTLTVSTGSGAPVIVNKSNGHGLTSFDLGNTIMVNPPTTLSTDDTTYTYKLTVSNAATTPASATTSGTLNVIPQPVLASNTFSITPAYLTGDTTPVLSLPLPALTSSAASASAVSLTISMDGGVQTPVNKTDGTAVKLSDLGSVMPIQVDPPSSSATDDTSYTYTVTVTNSATTPASAQATGALGIVPAPVLSASSFTLSSPVISGGSAQPLTLTLPSLTSPMATPDNTVSFTVDCGSGPVQVKKGGTTAVTTADLGMQISFPPPSTSANSNETCTYKLTVTNAANTSLSATGTLNVVPVPTLNALTFSASPSVINGGSNAPISLSLPAQSSPVASPVNTVGLTVACGSGTAAPVNKSGDSPIALTDLGGSPISVPAPSTSPSSNESCLYTLTLTNAAGAHTTATATVQVVATPVLSSNPALMLSNHVITGGLSGTFQITLPTVTSGAATPANTVTLMLVCGTGSASTVINNATGNPIALTDLTGNPIMINLPSTTANSNETCTYTLTLSNAAAGSTPATATVSVSVVPQPALASQTFTPQPNVITAGSSTPNSIALTLPAQSSPAATPVNTVSLAVNCGSGSVSVSKVGGGAVLLSDLGGAAINVPVPATPSNNSVCTYTLTLSNAADVPATSQPATATLDVVAVPTLSSNALTLNTKVITGGSGGTLKITLPSLTSGTPTPANQVQLQVACGGGASSTIAGVGAAQLGQQITVNNPSLLSTDNETCTYTLTVTNAAGTPANPSATGTLVVAPVPVLAQTFTPTPAVITSGSSANISLPLPALTSSMASTNMVSLNSQCNTDASSAVSKSGGGGAVVITDLGNPITVAPPTPSSTSSVCIYTLTVSNGADTPTTASSTATLDVVPTPALSTTTLTPAPSSITVDTTPTLTIQLPSLTSLAPPQAAPNSAGLTVNCGSGSSPVSKTNNGGGLVGIGDLNSSVTVVPINLSSAATCTYTLTVTNAAYTNNPANASTTATGTLNVIVVPSFGSASLSITPNVMLGGTRSTATLQAALPALATGAAASVKLTVAKGSGAATTLTKSNGNAIGPSDLGGAPISIFVPSTLASDNTAVFNYSLTAISAAGAATGTSAPVTATLTAFTPTTTLNAARNGATATLLPNGKVLIAGGGTSLAQGLCSSDTNTAEIYDPTTGVSTSTSTNMLASRCQHTATLVGNKVYLIGGVVTQATMLVDVFDTTLSPPAFVQSGVPPVVNVSRVSHTATLLGSGNILITGGLLTGNGNRLNSMELFSPTAGTSTNYTATLSVGRARHTANLMGKWLFLVGAANQTSPMPPDADWSVDAIDTTASPSASSGVVVTTTESASLPNLFPRNEHATVALNANTLMVIGGLNETAFITTDGVQLYTVDTDAGTVTNIPVNADLGTGIANFPAFIGNTSGTEVLAFGGSVAQYPGPPAGGGDIGYSTNLEVSAADGGTTSYATSLSTARQAAAAVNLNIAGATNQVFLVASSQDGGPSTADVIIGP